MLMDDDLYNATPSVERARARLCLFEKYCPGWLRDLSTDPSQTSCNLSPLMNLVGEFNTSQFPVVMKHYY